MEAPSYVFVSPYPSSFQVGRPDPNVKREEKIEQSDLSTSLSFNKAVEGQYLLKGDAAAINVALVSTNQQTSKALQQFSSLNSFAQANQAFSF